MSVHNAWLVIINPTSGNGSSKKIWPKISEELIANGFGFQVIETQYHKHSIKIIQDAVCQGVRDVICIGGDGTFHNAVNALMLQNSCNPNEITLGIIPIGTGNDWVKTYGIPKDVRKAVAVIKKGETKKQDVGLIRFPNQQEVYFNNLAGIGFDGHVVNKVNRYKRFGPLAYVIGATLGLFSFNNFKASVLLNGKEIKLKSLMVLVGICRYSGGGMRLTKDPVPNDGKFDVSIAGDLSRLDIIKNLPKLFNGKIVLHKNVDCYKTHSLQIRILQEEEPFVQADGELIGTGEFEVSILPNAISFYG